MPLLAAAKARGVRLGGDRGYRPAVPVDWRAGVKASIEARMRDLQVGDGGATFTFVWRQRPIRGVIHAALLDRHPDIVYASALNQGTWRSMDGGTTFTVLKARLSANDPDRPEFAVTKLPNGKTRMYLGEGVAGTPPARFFRTDDASGAAPVFTDLTTAQNINYCTGQCW
jgi:hypothetical protein